MSCRVRARIPAFPSSLVLPVLLAACAAPGGADTDASAAAAPARPAAIGAPDELVGLSAAEVERRIGAPGFTRRDGDARIWQYGGEACLLDVFLYRQAGGTTVRHAELRRREPGGPADGACLADALAKRS